MSNNELPKTERPYTPSDGEIKDAKDKIATDPRLADNPRIQAMVENDFMKENGEYVNPVEFVESATKFLDSRSGVSGEDIPNMDLYIDENLNVHTANPKIGEDLPGASM